MLTYYSLFCGVFLYEETSPADGSEFVPWENRLKDHDEFFNLLKRNYYPNFRANILDHQGETATFKHLTNAKTISGAMQFSFQRGENVISLTAPYFDIFLFKDGVGIFAFKVECRPDEELTDEKISAVLNHIRNPIALLTFENKQVTVLDFTREFLEPFIRLKKNWSSYIPQLKVYTVIDDSSHTSVTESMEQRLFEFSHVLPAGSFLNSVHSPSLEYYEKIKKESTINIYSNWKSEALFDSFTRISGSFPDKFRSWEQEYFLIYVHCLYAKFKLYRFNSQLKEVFPISQTSGQVRKSFIEFVNDYNLAYISYKFLPNTLYEKINQSMEIQKELDSMELKIERLNEAHQERKGKQLNTMLIVLSLLSIVSVITDLSQWLVLVGLPNTYIYSPSIAIGLWVLIALLAFGYIRKIKPFE